MQDYWKDFTVVEDGSESLGGNLHHGDTNAITPGFWRYLVDRFSVRTLLDIGSGEGHAPYVFHRLGVIAHGIDGLERNVRNAKYPIALHDLTKGPYIFPCDMTHCVEVAEHIEPAHVGNLMRTLINGSVVVMTHGLPGQSGHHHVNNQPQEYWVEKFDQQGFTLSIDNELFRDIAVRDVPNCYFSKSGLVFLRRS